MCHSSQAPAPIRLLLGLLLGASLGGCFSLEPLSSYSSGAPATRQPASAEEPALSEPEPEATPAAEPAPEPEGQMPVDEGVPGAGDIALEPAMQPDPMQSEPPASQPEALPSCAGPGEFSSADSGTCYLAATQSASWTDAFAACQMWGGGLVIIDSREEDELIGQHIAATSWTGASDLVQEGRMLWIGGAPVTFAHWAVGQPDDFQGREDCVVKTVPAGSWNDLPCRNLNAYVCERRAN